MGVGPDIVLFPKVSSALNDGVGTEITVESGIVEGEAEPDGAPAPAPGPVPAAPVSVTTMPPEVNTVSDAKDTVLLGAVALVMVKGGLAGRDSVGP